jgi:molybdenum cofactor synthesis domain-containing protein
VHTAAVVTASDGVSHGARVDTSGQAVADLLAGAGLQVAERVTVPDERDRIADALRRLADDHRVDLVVVTGGTGFGPRDVTPEATEDVIDRRAPGLAEAMRAAGRASTPMADLSRGTAGVRGTTLILNVPGSPRGATESVAAVAALLPHALQLLAGDTQQHPDEHGDLPAASSPGQVTAPEGTHGGVPHAASHGHDPDLDAACALAHGHGHVERDWTLVTISASPVSLMLLHWGRELGYRTVLVEPDDARISVDHRRHADRVAVSVDEAGIDPTCDVVATDHDIADLADHLAAALRSDARWIGLMGSPRHTAPHVAPLRERGFSDDQIARIERPIGLDIGSHTPAEIALATLAGLVADRNNRHVTLERS